MDRKARSNWRKIHRRVTEVPEATITGADIAQGPDIKGRLMFLWALRIAFPTFWGTLNRQVWKVQTLEAFSWWASRWNVVDEWLIQVARDTIEYWGANPTSPDALLRDDYRWYLYRPGIEREQPSFHLVVENPRPLILQAGPFPLRKMAQLVPPKWTERPSSDQCELQAALNATRFESMEEFKTRMRCAFEEQLREYQKTFDKNLNFDKDPATARDAGWTAARFCGAGYMQIARIWPGLDQPYRPDKTVNVAVRRFADRIGLTLPNPR